MTKALKKELYKCKGRVQIFHDYLNDNSNDLNDWKKKNIDIFPLLIAFGVICGVFWIGTGVLGFIAKDELLMKIYIAAGAASYAIHAMIFPIIVTRASRMDDCSCSCYNLDNLQIKHISISNDMFMGASLICFAGGAYTIIGAALCHRWKSVTVNPHNQP